MGTWKRRLLLAAACWPIWTVLAGELKEVKLPTVDEGEVSYFLDTETKLPVGAEDERAKVTAVAFSFLPKASGEPLRWAFMYGVKFKPGAVPRSIAIYTQNSKALQLEVEEGSPRLNGDMVLMHSAAHEMDETAFRLMTDKEPWILQRKFVITYTDGAKKTLHQLAVIPTATRVALLNSIVDARKSPAPAVPDFDARPWKVGFDRSGKDQRITEFVLDGQTVESWRELITRQEIGDPEQHFKLAAIVERTRAGLAQNCPSLNWRILRQSDTEVVYEWSHDECGTNPAQYEIAKMRRTARGICRWAYASKDMPMTAEKQDTFRPVVDKLGCDAI